MLANMTCWVIALGLIFSESVNREDLYIKSALAIGFIFVGVLSKTADYYRDVKMIELGAKDKNGECIASAKE